jgi:hypothetical protein
MAMSKCGSILIKDTTRKRLKYIGRKDQTYDELINELLDLKNGSGYSFAEATDDR